MGWSERCGERRREKGGVFDGGEDVEIRKRCEDAYENNGLDGGERSMVGQGPHHSTHFRLSV